MKRVIIFPLIFLSIYAFAQTPIKGIVVDKDNKKPISDVIVQYGASSKEYAYTNISGQFSIPENSEDVIHFQSIGYKSKSVLKSVLRQQPTVIMELNPVSLNPVVISPYDADMLLEEVMLNTKKNLVTEHPIGYLLHFLQTKTTDTLQNEIYLKYTTSLDEKVLKKSLKKERIPYTYNIVDIRRLQKSVTPTSELYGAEYHASHLLSFGKSINKETTRTYTSDSSLIILNIEPLPGKDGWANGEVRINKSDMTIKSMEIESVDSILASQPAKKYLGNMVQVLRKVGRFEFAKASNGKYYMKECYTYYKFSAMSEFGRREEIVYHCDVNCIGNIDQIKVKRRKLGGYCQELFYFPDSTPDDFWTFNNTSSSGWSDYRSTGELSLGDNSSKKAKGIPYYLGKYALVIPLAAILILI